MFAKIRSIPSDMPPIIFLTGHHNSLIGEDALALGAHAYFDKNKMSRSVLVDVIDEAISGIV